MTTDPTTSPSPSRLAVLATVSLLFIASLTILFWSDLARGEGIGGEISLALAFSSFFCVGVVIALRRPRHPIGWLFVASGVYPLVQEALVRLGDMSADRETGELLHIISNTAFSWPALLGTLVVFVPLLFPTGRLPSPRWRWLAGLVGTAMAIMAVGGVFQREVCAAYDREGICTERLANPIGVPWLDTIEESAVGSALFGVLVVGMVGAGISVVIRYRRARGAERAQLRWFTFAMGLFLTYMLVMGVLVEEVLGMSGDIEAVMPWGIDPFGVFLSLVPVSVGVAILRYRLYDIDKLISRTVGYGLITGVSLAGYAGAVFVLRRLLPGQSDLAVAGSTLAVAAAFDPLRRRIQAIVDRRFNRSRFDSERVVEEYGVRLRTGTGIEEVTGELIDAATRTMQPATMSLWMGRGHR